MTPRRYRWLGDPHERQHVFLDDRERSLCQMAVRTAVFARRPESLQCFWCMRQLKHLIKKGRVAPEQP